MADPKDPECCEVPQCITVPPNPTNGTIVITGVTGQIIVSANKSTTNTFSVLFFFFGIEFNEFLSPEYYDTFILYDILYRILLEQVW